MAQARSGDDPLQRYAARRNFARTPEPEPKARDVGAAAGPAFVIQKHWATRLHYDFRLELDGVLLSWAVPKGPSFDPADKRMAIHVEDHPVSYGGFEGTIPKGQYGAGKVIVWDQGTWEPVGDPREGLAQGKLVFRLHGQKLAGLWELVRIAKPGDRQEAWLLFKKRDEWARPASEYDVIAALPDSVVDHPLGPLEARTARPDGDGAAGAAEVASAAEVPSAAEAPGARRADLPPRLQPQLATLASDVPKSGTWVCEVKFDGYRLLARIEGGRARLITRQGNDWTSRLKPLAAAVEKLPVDSAWLDGEIVVLDDQGVPSFNRLQNAFDTSRPKDIVYFLFDAPFLDGHDLRGVPLSVRRALVRRIVEGAGSEALRFSEAFEGDPRSILDSACRLRLEGIIAKRADARYEPGRTTSWLKLKCQQRQEFVIGGYTDRAGSVAEVGSLLLGYYDDEGRLRYAGNVGTGWNAATAADLRRQLAKLEVDASPFDGEVKPGRWSRRAPGGEHWVKPRLVAEVSFSEWTPDGRVRAASFQGLRSDKPAREIRRESAVAVERIDGTGSAADASAARPAGGSAGKAPTARPAGGTAGKASARPAGGTASKAPTARPAGGTAGKASARPAGGTASKAPAAAGGRTAEAPNPRSAGGRTAEAPTAGPSGGAASGRAAAPRVGSVKVSNPQRVIDPSSGLTKLDLVRYYEGVADRMLPHLKGRPVALLRAPEGVHGELFFQKHDDNGSLPLRRLDRSLWPGHDALLEVDSVEALVGAAQMNVVEFHTGNATVKHMNKPDRVVFDIDPGEGVKWAQVQEAALLVRTLLEELALESWLKTSGGKGLHVVVPVTPRLDHDAAKDFSQAAVQHLARTIPSRFVAKSGGSNRIGKIFIDYLRNSFTATTAAAFSARARPGLGVSMPVSWEQLPELKGGAQWTVATAREYLSFEEADPWADYWTTRQTLTRARKRLGL